MSSEPVTWMKRLTLATLAAAMALPLLAQPSAADDRGRRDRHQERHREWHGDIRRFHDHDYDRWRGGRWYHGHHDGRLGWWWIVGGLWFFYPTPVYPYPDPYVPPAARAPMPGNYWYYCRNPAGYYPYVPYCRVPWRAVRPEPRY